MNSFYLIKLKLTVFCTLAFTSYTLNAQVFSSKLKFEEPIDVVELSKEAFLENKEEVILKDHRVVEFNYNNEGDLKRYFYIHKRVFVKSDEAVSRNNKIYVSFSKALKLIDYDARVISPKNEIKQLGKDALKEGVNEDDVKYNYFAISGAEIGSIVEYYYLVESSVNLHGNLNSITNKAFTKEFVFELISPPNLIFETNVVKGFSMPVQDTSIVDFNFLRSTISNIEPLKDEPFSNSGAEDPTIFFHLKTNKSIGKGNFYTFGVASQNVFENINIPFSKKEEKLADKVLKESKAASKKDEKEKIMALELYLKQNFSVYSDNDARLETPESIFDIKAFNELGAVKLYNHFFDKLGIESELVLTSNRFRFPFRDNFESYTFLEKYLFYFPNIDSYLNPEGKFDRLDVIPYGFIHNYGLFIKKVSFSGISTGSGVIKFIKAPKGIHTQNNMFIEARLGEDLDSLQVNLKQTYTGYYAQSYQPYFGLIPADVEKEITEDFVFNIIDDAKIKSIEVVNGGFEEFSISPLEINAEFTSPSLIERAGDKILVKVGDLIGPQSELYQEEKRTLPVENSFNRKYFRSMKIEIPKGYTCKNLDDLIINVDPFNNKQKAFFSSTYKLNGNTVEVEIDEIYDEIFFPLENFEDYRVVINAAADFNKVVLVFEPI